MDYNELKPKKIFHFFQEICRIPHPSKHEEKMIAYIRDFAVTRGLWNETDESGNILVRKPATAGYEKRPGVALQAHVDMVPDKRKGVQHNFLTDPIRTKIDGEWLSAQGTTLGADDGIGVAAALAILDSEDLKHGPLECLFTVDEETSLGGAYSLRPGWLQSPYLINLDSEDEGEIFIGCAGGNCLHAELTYTPEPAPATYFYLRIGVEGLTGGHSGGDIHKGHANAIKLISSFANRLMDKYDLRICSLKGGSKHNAIPIEASMLAAVPMKDKEPVRIDLNVFASEMEREYKITDPFLKMTMGSESVHPFQWPEETARRILYSLVGVHTGVYAFSQEAPGFTHTSNNLAIVNTTDKAIEIHCSQRSESEFSLEEITRCVAAPFKMAGATIRIDDAYPGWPPVYDSHLLQVAKESYRTLFSSGPEVKTIHAGLECGLFLQKYPAMEMISIGPTLRNVHTPEEKMHIPSVKAFWEHLTHLLAEL